MSDKEEEAEAKEAPRMFDALHAIELQDMGGRPLPPATTIACRGCCGSALSLCSALLQGRGCDACADAAGAGCVACPEERLLSLCGHMSVL